MSKLTVTGGSAKGRPLPLFISTFFFMSIQVQGILYLPSVSKSISRVGKFTRCPAHGNLLAWLGRPLPLTEFNTVAPTVLQNAALYGMQPFVKLVEVEIPDPETKPDPSAGTKTEIVPDSTKPAGTTSPASKDYDVEPLNDGFVVVDLRTSDVLYRGQGEQWESEISLVRPFSTEDEARAVIPTAVVTTPVTASIPPSTPPVSPKVSKEPKAPKTPKTPKTPKATKTAEAPKQE